MRAGRAVAFVSAHLHSSSSSSSRGPCIKSSSTLHCSAQTHAQLQQRRHATITRPLQAAWPDPQHGSGAFPSVQQRLAAQASRRSVSSSGYTSDPSDGSGSGSDSDSDATSCLGIDPSELGPNGELPWYYTDSKVKAAWQIQDKQEVEHWREVMAKLEK
jgi:hypothetical protein